MIIPAYSALFPMIRSERLAVTPDKDRALIPDVFTAAAKTPPKNIHKWHQSQPETERLISCLTGPGALICDPCVGIGTVAAATVKVGGKRRFVGYDVDQKCVKGALGRATGDQS